MAWPETVRKDDLRIDYYRGSGKGGQHRNKTDSACRITHLPTGIVAQSEEERSQPRNRKAAFARLTSQVVPLMKEAALRSVPREKSTERIRTYHEPDQRVKDHRTGKTYRYSDVLLGNGLEEVLNDVVVKKNKEELEKCDSL
jgi:peptide chain release factor 1